MHRPEYRIKLADIITEIRGRLPSITKELYDILLRKNKDYTSNTGNQFEGFIDAAEFSGIDGPERVIFSRITDKFKRISNLLQSEDDLSVTDEKIRETAIDIAGYSVILVAFLDWAETLLKDVENDSTRVDNKT